MGEQLSKFGDPDIGMCDWCGSIEGKRVPTDRGWTCPDCLPQPIDRERA